MLTPVKTSLTADTYHRTPEYAEQNLIQLIDGEIVIAMLPTPPHQEVVLLTAILLRTIAAKQGGKVYISPIEVYFDDYNSPEPDVVHLAAESRCQVQDKLLVGAPELIVEVLSPSTAKHDREDKFRLYEAQAVREYWIADPINRYLEVWTLRDSVYVKLGTYVAGDTFTSPVLNTLIVVSEMLPAE